MKVSCSAAGGPSECPFVAEGDSADQIVQKLNDHAASTHPDIFARMQAMSEQEKSDWVNTVKSKIQP